MQHRIDVSMDASLDKKMYDENELISIKKPITVPYYNNSSDYTIINGETEYKGVLYKYVKCRIYKDSLEMLCIPNHSKQQWQLAAEQYGKSVNDIPQQVNNKKSPTPGKNIISKNLFSEFEDIIKQEFMFYNELHKSLYSSLPLRPVKDPLDKSLEQPPDVFLLAVG